MSNDLISREYIKAFICEYEKFNGKETEIVKAIPIQAIDNAPTIEERPTGKWIEHYDSEDGFSWLTCSRCMANAYENDYKYCPNCGAKMKQEAENEQVR